MKYFSVRLYCPSLFSGYGGAEKYTATIAQFLAVTYKSIDLKFVVYDESKNYINPIALLNERYSLSLPSDIGIIFLKERSSTFVGKYFAHQKLRSTSRNVDLYINCFHNIHYFYARKNVHLIHFPAGRRVNASPLFSRNGLIKQIGALLDKKYERCYDLFICNSMYSKEWLYRYWGIKEQKSIVLYPPVSDVPCSVEKEVSKKEKTILMVSRYDQRKNMLEAVEYFVRQENLFSDWRLIVAGSMGEGEKEYYKNILKVADGHRVSLYANISKYELDNLYCKAAIFWHSMGLKVDENVNPVDIEHFGITTVEAMAAGAVPVVIDKGGQREIVDDGINGIRWGSLDEMGQATRRLIEDEALRERLSRAAKAKSAMYSYSVFMQTIEEVFDSNALIPSEFKRKKIDGKRQ